MIQTFYEILPPGRVRRPARTAGSARVNEKTAENPRSWPLISGHLAPQGRWFAGFSLFFQSGKMHRSRKAFWYFSAEKSTKQTSIPALDQFPGVKNQNSSRVSQKPKAHNSQLTIQPASAKANSQQLIAKTQQPKAFALAKVAQVASFAPSLKSLQYPQILQQPHKSHIILHKSA
jgi:hypothetical protein